MFYLAPAHFAEKYLNQTARLGSNASLRCEAKGDHPLKMMWQKAGSLLEITASNYHYTRKEINKTDVLISILGITTTTRDDSGRYFCVASNSYGQDRMTIHLFVQGKAILYFVHILIDMVWVVNRASGFSEEPGRY